MQTAVHFLIILLISTTMKAQTIVKNTINSVNNDREFFETLGKIYPVSPAIKISETEISNVKCYWFRPQSSNTENIFIIPPDV